LPDNKSHVSRFSFQIPPGFTLLEVMIALSVISIALMALLGSQSQGLSLASESRFNTTASLLAQGKMADIEAVGDQRDLASDSGNFGDEFPDYAWEVSVNDVSFEGAGKISDRLKRIDLEVFSISETRYRYRLRLYRFFPSEP
jgi:general secretion pathway protein I